MIKRWFAGFAATLMFATSLVAQKPTAAVLAKALPTDTAVTMGVLPNGLHYYIRYNAKPEKRAELRLVVNAGSILETDSQLGYAHFIEHTAFNGTTHFQKNDLVKYLQSIGVRFGADLNASTGFDQTVYILPVPTDTARIVESAFQILEDWAHGQTFDSTEVMNERGVVTEEWRDSKGASDRMLKQWLPIALSGSKYALRLPIGTEKSINSVTPSGLRQFYKDWYRPDLMAVVAVGDFDKTQIEALIKSHFGAIPKAVAPKVRTTATVPANVAPLVAIATDAEATESDVNLIFKVPHKGVKTVADYRRSIAEGLYIGMLNNRLVEISQKPDAPFLGAGAGEGGFVARNLDAFTLSAGVKDGTVEAGTLAILNEARRADQFGFLQTELDREKANMLRGWEQAFAERDKTNSSAFVGQYIGNFLTGDPIPGLDAEYKMVQQLLPTITINDVDSVSRGWMGPTNRIVIVQAPKKDGVQVPTQAQMLAVFTKASGTKLAAYTENLSGDALLNPLPTPGKVVATKSIPEIGVIEWTLSNGVRVLVRPTDYKADEVVFRAYALGGTSLASDSMFMSADNSSDLMAISGLGSFNRVDLGKKLTGKAVSVSPAIGETDEALVGGGSPKDIETLFQLINLNFTAPRIDTAAFQAALNQLGPYVANRGQDPESVLADTIAATMTQHAFRARPLTAATLAEIDPGKAWQFFHDRFADASGFTFVFVGNVNMDSLKPLVERYLASLPTTGKKEMWVARGNAPPAGVIQKVVHKGIEPKAHTIFAFTGPAEYTPENRFAMYALTSLVQIRLDEVLREMLGGTYSPSVYGSLDRVPRAEYGVNVDYGSSPANVDKLSAAVLAVIDSLKTNGPAAADVEKVREEIIRSRQVQIKQNAYWVNNIASRSEAGEDITGLMVGYDDMIKKLSADQIRDAARKYFNTSNYVRIVLLPETAGGQ